jgi:hypothetical protein
MKQDKKKQKLTEGGAQAPPVPIPTTMRVRMLRQAGTMFGYLPPGRVLEIPADTARKWVAAGIAEFDKMLDGAPETK